MTLATVQTLGVMVLLVTVLALVWLSFEPGALTSPPTRRAPVNRCPVHPWWVDTQATPCGECLRRLDEVTHA